MIEEIQRLRGNNYDIVVLIDSETGEEHLCRCKPGTLELSDYEEGEQSSPSRFDT